MRCAFCQNGDISTDNGQRIQTVLFGICYGNREFPQNTELTGNSLFIPFR
jgi:hypothetical protein